MNVQVIRSLCVLLIGILFLTFGGSALSLMVVAVGVLLMIPSVISLVSYVRHLAQRPMFPLAALGSFVLGFWMVLSPLFFVNFFMYVIGGVLVALGVYQLAGLSVTSRVLSVVWPLYLLPVVVLLLGLFVIFNPFEAATLPFVLIGIGCIISAVNDMVAAVRTVKRKKKEKKAEEIDNVLTE